MTHAAIVRRLGAAYVRPHVAVLLASLRDALIRGTRSRLFCPEALASLTAIALSFGEEVALQAAAADQADALLAALVGAYWRRYTR